jgi:hypothetical protein
VETISRERGQLPAQVGLIAWQPQPIIHTTYYE